jgi:hypothetical protein
VPSGGPSAPPGHLFSNPEHGDYSRTSAAPFGHKLNLPKPFDFALDTAPFAD